MKPFLALLSCLFLACPSFAQTSVGFAAQLGGNGLTQALGSAVDTNGNTFVTGNTLAANLATPGAFQTNYPGTRAAFVAEFNSAGSLVFFTYLGGSAVQSGQGLVLDSQGDIIVTGYTSSTNFPTKNPLQATNAGGYDAFVAALSPGGGALVYSTYLGGKGFDAANGIGMDTNDEPVIVGYTQSTNLPTANAFQPTNGGSGDAFLSKLAANGGSLLYSTYFGGRDSENGPSTALNGVVNSVLAGMGGAVAVGLDGSAYITGWTYSTNLPVKNAFQPTNRFAFSGAISPYVAKFDPAGNLAYSTYFGGYLYDYGRAIGVDGFDNVYFAGNCDTPDMPVTNAFQPAYVGGYNAGLGDAFLAALDATGTNLLYCTYLGGSGDDEINGLTVTPDGRVAVTGCTDSPNFPTLNAAETNSHMGFLSTSDGGANWRVGDNGLSSALVGAIAVDPFNPSHLFALASSLYQSADQGRHWTAVNFNFAEGSYYSSQGLLAFDPMHAGTLYYGAYYSLQKTTDGGATWTTLTNGLPSPAYIQAVAVDPNTPSIVYVGTDAGGLFKSYDSGTNWTAMNTGLNNHNVTAVLVDPANSSNVFVGVDNYTSTALCKSTNGGTNFSVLSGLPSFEYPVVALACSAASPSYIYALIGDFVNMATLCSTTNGGASWSQALQLQLGSITSLAVAAPSRPVLSIADAAGMFTLSWPASFTNFILQTSATLANPVWQTVSQLPVLNGAYENVTLSASANAGFYRLAYTNQAALPPNVFLGCDQLSLMGVLRSANGGATWTKLGLAGDTINALAADPADPNTIYTGLTAGFDAFAASFTADGQLNASTYVGGSGFDQGCAISVNGTDAILSGVTFSPEFSAPASPAAQPQFDILNPGVISPPPGGDPGRLDGGALLVEALKQYMPCPQSRSQTIEFQKGGYIGTATILSAPGNARITSQTTPVPPGTEYSTYRNDQWFTGNLFGTPTVAGTYNWTVSFHQDPDCDWTVTLTFIVK